jgi:radical SAM protein with 4Fe4S-binding SPASM domain
MTPEDFAKHPALCALPWHGIYINPDGAVKNCAISAQTLGNIHDSQLPDIMNNVHNREIRQDMLSKIKHVRCDSCYQVEHNSGSDNENESNRSWYKKVTLKHESNFNFFDRVDNFVPVVLDLRWRNTCNQACVYCGPDLSSLWAEKVNHPFRINDQILTQSKEWIFSNLKSVKHVYLAGGEPLLIKENQRLLEKLLEEVPDVDIRINTNLSSIDNPVFQLLKKFANVKWTVSVDSKEELFEYMRWPGHWKTFLHNLKVLQSVVGDQINFNMVWCILNDIDIIDTIDYLIDQGYHENMFVVQCLIDPSPLSILHLPISQKKELQRQILNRQNRCNQDWWLYKSLRSMYNFLDRDFIEPRNISFQGQQPLSSGLQGTFEYLKNIDKIQNKDSRNIFPRLYQYQ